jgi:hypothetical protein
MATLPLTPKEEIQLYTNEYVGHNVINRGLFRLWDNDLVVYSASQVNLAAQSAVLAAVDASLQFQITENDGELAVLNALYPSWVSCYSSVNGLSGAWNGATTTVNAGSPLWDSTWTTVLANSATWSAASTVAGIGDLDDVQDAVSTVATDGAVLTWNDTAGEWEAQIAPGGAVTEGTVSAIVEAFDTTRNWTNHISGNVEEVRHLTSAWYDAFAYANVPKNSNPVATIADISNGLDLPDLTVLVHSETAGTDGGTFSNGSRQTRSISFRHNFPTYLAISSDRLTLSAGAYYVEGEVGAGPGVGAHKAWIRNITQATDLMVGSNGYDTSPSHFQGTFEIDNNSEEIEIQHQCTNTVSNSGFGVAGNFGSDEIYLNVAIWRFQDNS